jgi:hypothetical protein
MYVETMVGFIRYRLVTMLWRWTWSPAEETVGIYTLLLSPLHNRVCPVCYRAIVFVDRRLCCVAQDVWWSQAVLVVTDGPVP